METKIKDISQLKSERIKELKLYKAVANKILEQNIKYKNNHGPSWQNETVENNIKSIKEIIIEINDDLKSNKRIDEYCLGMSGDRKYFIEVFRQKNSISFFGNITNYTIPGSVDYDINWPTHFTLCEKIDIAIGKKSPEILADNWDYVESKISKSILPELKKNKDFSEHSNLILEAITIAKRNSFIVSNLILITVAESMVRVLTKKVYKGQNPTLSDEEAQKYIDNCQSLENLLIKTNWKNDIEIPIIEAVIKYGYINEPEITSAKQVLTKAKRANRYFNERTERFFTESEAVQKSNEELEKIVRSYLSDLFSLQGKLLESNDQKVKINLRILLHFLIRRFKEDRNTIIHGKFEGFNQKWKNYIYLSVIEQIFEAIKTYQKIYPTL